jgi:hypothetical protein
MPGLAPCPHHRSRTPASTLGSAPAAAYPSGTELASLARLCLPLGIPVESKWEAYPAPASSTDDQDREGSTVAQAKDAGDLVGCPALS